MSMKSSNLILLLFILILFVSSVHSNSRQVGSASAFYMNSSGIW